MLPCIRKTHLKATGPPSSSSWPPPISGHDLMAIFPTVPPSTNVCCNDIFSKQARAYLSGSKDDTATTEGDAGRAVPREARHRRTNTTDSSRSPSFVGSEHSRNGLDALAEQACLESSSIRTPPLDRGGSRTADRPERDAEGANGRPTRSRQSKVRALRYLRAQAVHRSCLGLRPDTSFPLDIKAQRDGGLLRAGTPDRRTTTPRPSSSQADSSTPLFTRRPLERTAYPRFVSQS